MNFRGLARYPSIVQILASIGDYSRSGVLCVLVLCPLQKTMFVTNFQLLVFNIKAHQLIQLCISKVLCCILVLSNTCAHSFIAHVTIFYIIVSSIRCLSCTAVAEPAFCTTIRNCPADHASIAFYRTTFSFFSLHRNLLETRSKRKPVISVHLVFMLCASYLHPLW